MQALAVAKVPPRPRKISLGACWGLLIVVLIAAACGGAAPRPPAPAVTLPATPTPAATAVPATIPSPSPDPAAGIFPTPFPAPLQPAPAPTVGNVRRGGTLFLVSRENIAHQDVHQEVSPALSTWGPGIAYSRLMRLKSGPGVRLPSLAVECDLCESWEMENDRTYLFRLREGIRWQDIPPVNGRLLTSNDIIYSYNRQRQEGWPNAPLLQGIETMEAPAPDLLRITLLAPDADFLLALADGHSKIVAREAVQLHGDLKDGPTIGTGPWILTETRPGVAHVFLRNPDYFEKGLPLADKLVVRIIEDPATRNASFSVGDIDVHQMELEEWEKFHEKHPDAPHVMIKDAGVGLEVVLKASAPPFDDERVRRAVFQAMDPWKSVQEVWRGAAFASLGIPLAADGWQLPEAELREFVGHPELARDLLRQTGLKLPVPVTIKVGDFGEAYLAHARQLAEQMKAVGFAPALEVVDRREFGDEVWLGGDYQMFVGPPPPFATPNGYLFSVLHSRGKANTTGHRDAELDLLIEAQSREFDPLARQELVRQVQRRVLAKAYRIMTATHISIWTWWPRVQDLYPNFAASEYFHWARVSVGE